MIRLIVFLAQWEDIVFILFEVMQETLIDVIIIIFKYYVGYKPNNKKQLCLT